MADFGRVLPYRTPAPRTEPKFRVEGAELVVQDDAALRAVCLVCGSKKDVEFHHRTLTNTNNGAGTGAAGGVVGSAIARTAKQDIGLAILVGGVAAVVVGGVVWLVYRPKPGQTVRVDLPSCISCDDKLRASAGRTRSIAIVGLVALGGSFVLAALKIWVLAALLFVAFFGFVIYSTRLRKNGPQPARVRAVENGNAFLVGVAPRALELFAEVPRKKKKKKNPPPPSVETEETADPAS